VTHAVAYYRVSRRPQAVSGLGVDAQRHAVESYARQHGLVLCESYFEVETGTGRRPRVEIHKAIAASKRLDAVLLIGKLDRLARSVAFTSNLMDSDVNFVAVDMPDANRLTVHIMAALAEHEARLISQRTKEALEQARTRGVRLGRPENLGHEDRLRGARVNATKAAAAARPVYGYARVLRDEGWSYERIARQLNSDGFVTRQGKAWRATQVKRVLDRQPAGRLTTQHADVSRT